MSKSKTPDYAGYQDAWKKSQEGKGCPGISVDGTGKPAEIKAGDAIVPGSMSESDARMADAILRSEHKTIELD